MAFTATDILVVISAVLATLIPLLLYTTFYFDPIIKCMILRRPYDPTAFARKHHSRGPIVYELSVTGWTWMVYGEKAGKWLLVQEKGKMVSGGQARPRHFQTLVKGSILDQDFAEHARTRRLLAPPFRTENLRTYLPTMLQTTSALLSHWTQKSHTAPNIDLQQELKQLTLRLAFLLLVGADLPSVEVEPELTGRLAERYKKFLVEYTFAHPRSLLNVLKSCLD